MSSTEHGTEMISKKHVRLVGNNNNNNNNNDNNNTPQQHATFTFMRRQPNALSATRHPSRPRSPSPCRESFAPPLPSTPRSCGGGGDDDDDDRHKLWMRAIARESRPRSILRLFVSSCRV